MRKSTCASMSMKRGSTYSHWPFNLAPDAHRLSFTTSMKEALSKADFVQENGPERQDFKIKLFADMDDATPADSLIASSSSGITPSVMQSKCKHPWNGSELDILLIRQHYSTGGSGGWHQDVDGCNRPGDGVLFLDWQEAICLRKEIPGHVANRLQTALYKEVLYLIEAERIGRG